MQILNRQDGDFSVRCVGCCIQFVSRVSNLLGAARVCILRHACSSYGVDILFCFGHAVCAIDKSVTRSPTQVAYRNHIRHAPETGFEGVAGTDPCSSRKNSAKIIDGALFLLQHKVSYWLCRSLPYGVLFAVCLLFWIHTTFHTMHT